MSLQIVFVTPSIKTGGGNRVFIELANQLCHQHNVSIVYPNNSADIHTFYKDDKVQYIPIGRVAVSKWGKALNLLRCIQYLNKLSENVRIVVTDPIFCLMVPWLRYKKRIYRFIQADDYRIFDDGKILGTGLVLRGYKYFCLRAYRQSIHYIFNSKFVYDQFCRDSARTDVQFALVHPAINHDIFKPVPDSNELDKQKCSVCLIARQHPWKGLVTFINAFHSLPQPLKSQISKVTLVSHDDLTHFDTKGMEIVKPYSDEDIAKVYQGSDIFISTSWWEGFGLPPLEAMACGCAVITSRSGGINEYAVDRQNCLMYEPRNEQQLINMLTILIQNGQLRKDLVKNGLDTAQQYYWAKEAEKFVEIIS